MVVIGAGVVGCLVARALSRYQLRVMLLEKESDVGTGASSANTAIVHAGYDPPPGTLKAILNVSGNRMWDQLAGELEFAFERRGDYVVALGDHELPALEALRRRGIANGVPGLQIVPAERVRVHVPDLSSEATAALWAPTGGICDPFGVVVAAAENAVTNGMHLQLETAFEDFEFNDHRIVGIRSSKGSIACRWVVNAAGICSDQVMHKAGVRPEFRITPRKGEYYVLDRARSAVQAVLFPVPSESSKGIMVTTTVHGNTIIGPNSREIADRGDRAITSEGLDEVWRGATQLIPGLDTRDVIAIFAGLRATGNAPCTVSGVNYEHDFVVEVPENITGLVNLGGIESPGLTAAPAIAERVVQLLRDSGEPLREKKDWNPLRKARPRFRDLSREERKRLVENNPAYGRIVCRCEYVTEGEVIAEIHAPVPAHTYDAIKRRTWLGTGRCQGSFDTPRVVEILARELGISPLEVTKKGHGSAFLSRRTKETES